MNHKIKIRKNVISLAQKGNLKLATDSYQSKFEFTSNEIIDSSGVMACSAIYMQLEKNMKE